MTVAGFFGGLLIVVGVLGALLSGGCTLFFIFTSVSNLSGIGGVLLIGGIPFFVCLALIKVGKAILRNKNNASIDKIDVE